jgi:hypothetical protein
MEVYRIPVSIASKPIILRSVLSHVNQQRVFICLASLEHHVLLPHWILLLQLPPLLLSIGRPTLLLLGCLILPQVSAVNLKHLRDMRTLPHLLHGTRDGHAHVLNVPTGYSLVRKDLRVLHEHMLVHAIADPLDELLLGEHVVEHADVDEDEDHADED